MEIGKEEKEDKIKFKEVLEKFTAFFSTSYDKEKAQNLKVEINEFDRDVVINLWVELLKSHVPIEKVEENKYEIYDVTNIVTDSQDTSGSYIHTIELDSFETSSSIFMKFYFIFYCIVNEIRSNEYKISYTSGGWM